MSGESAIAAKISKVRHEVLRHAVVGVVEENSYTCLLSNIDGPRKRTPTRQVVPHEGLDFREIPVVRTGFRVGVSRLLYHRNPWRIGIFVYVFPPIIRTLVRWDAKGQPIPLS
jgi:hypothetical protein